MIYILKKIGALISQAIETLFYILFGMHFSQDFYSLRSMVQKKDLEAIQKTLEQHRNKKSLVNQKDFWKKPLLAYAIDTENVEIIQTLIDAGADMNAKSWWLGEPLSEYAKKKNNVEISKGFTKNMASLQIPGALNPSEPLASEVNLFEKIWWHTKATPYPQDATLYSYIANLPSSKNFSNAALSYHIVDVEGDGSCGFYALQVATLLFTQNNWTNTEQNKFFEDFKTRTEYFSHLLERFTKVKKKFLLSQELSSDDSKNDEFIKNLFNLSLQEKAFIVTVHQMIMSLMSLTEHSDSNDRENHINNLKTITDSEKKEVISFIKNLTQQSHLTEVKGEILSIAHFLTTLSDELFTTCFKILSNTNFYFDPVALLTIAIDKGFLLNIISIDPLTGFISVFEGIDTFESIFAATIGLKDEEKKSFLNTQNRIYMMHVNRNHFMSLIDPLKYALIRHLI